MYRSSFRCVLCDGGSCMSASQIELNVICMVRCLCAGLVSVACCVKVGLAFLHRKTSAM